jgi:hypothetical protein
MPAEFKVIFQNLRQVLERNGGNWVVQEDSSSCYSLAGKPGPATLSAWGGKLTRSLIPLAWVQIGKAYVSYHLMGLYGNEQLLGGISKELKARMQGKTCFNFKSRDEALFAELEDLSCRSRAAFRKAGYVLEPNAGEIATNREAIHGRSSSTSETAS